MNRYLLRFRILFFVFLMSTLISASISFSNEDTSRPLIYTINIEGIISRGTTDYISRSIELAEANQADALVLLINTPGGLVDATLVIIEALLASDVPIITYVAPQGAIAASAGSFILVSGHTAAMSPGTTCGAAMPVTIGFSEEGSTSNAADEKTIKFLAGHIRSVAEERGRNGDVVEQFVTENLTLNAQEALDNKVIDYISRDLNALLDELDGEEIIINGKATTLNTSEPNIVPLGMNTQEKATSLISNPQLSFLLVIIGLYGLVIGFNAPETYIPEVGGAIALMAGLYGLGMFEVNLFAALMIVLGIIMLIAEALTPTYGVLSVGGILSIVLGGIFLPKEPLMPLSWFSNLISLVLGLGIGASLLMIVILRGILKIRRKKAVHGMDEYSGITATILELDGRHCTVMVRGELWQGLVSGDIPLKIGQPVQVINREGIVLNLTIPPTDQQS